MGICVCVCGGVWAYVCVCVCGGGMGMCVCVCVCVYWGACVLGADECTRIRKHVLQSEESTLDDIFLRLPPRPEHKQHVLNHIFSNGFFLHTFCWLPTANSIRCPCWYRRRGHRHRRRGHRHRGRDHRHRERGHVGYSSWCSNRCNR